MKVLSWPKPTLPHTFSNIRFKYINDLNLEVIRASATFIDLLWCVCISDRALTFASLHFMASVVVVVVVDPIKRFKLYNKITSWLISKSHIQINSKDYHRLFFFFLFFVGPFSSTFFYSIISICVEENSD